MKGSIMNRAELVEASLERLCELDHRSGNSIDVMLVWEPVEDCVFVGVIDQCTGTEFAVEVDPANALDAFYHPFAYQARRAHDRRVAVEV